MLLEICESRHDDWSKAVNVRLQDVATTLPAYDGRYHVDCYNAFRKISTNSSKPLIEEPLQHVVNHINTNSSTSTWTVGELHRIYTDASGELVKKQMLTNLSEYYGEELVVLSVPGCETQLGLSTNVGRGTMVEWLQCWLSTPEVPGSIPSVGSSREV